MEESFFILRAVICPPSRQINNLHQKAKPNRIQLLTRLGSEQGQYRPQQQHRKGYTPQQQFNHHSQNSSLLGSPGIWEKMRNLKGVSVSQGGKKTSKGQEESGSVKVKLPLAPVNGKRPNVELVMLQVRSLTNFAHIVLKF